MTSIEDIKVAADALAAAINAFKVVPPVAEVSVEEVAKVETEVAAIDAELKADIA